MKTINSNRSAYCLRLERLRESEVQLALRQVIETRRADLLGDDERRRIEKEAVIDTRLAADRRLDAESKTDRVGPLRVQVAAEDLALRDVRRTENILRRCA